MKRRRCLLDLPKIMLPPMTHSCLPCKNVRMKRNMSSPDRSAVPDLMELKEVAAYLRIGERTVYDLVKQKKIPCSRVTGKWLFPKRLVDLWIDQNTEAAALGRVRPTASRVVAGSHDPLLEWAVRESGCNMAMLSGGSRSGLDRLYAAEAVIAGIHLYDPAAEDFNVAALAAAPLGEWVAITMAQRQQGLVVANGNPLQIATIADLVAANARVVLRQPGAGSRELWDCLREQSGYAQHQFTTLNALALTETDLALAIREGVADAGLAIESAARNFGLGFIPLKVERFDLVMLRREYFSADVQRLFACIMGEAFALHAASLAGYDLAKRGQVVFNS
ncbi:MAG: substrate-binding domain-containing protein [Burkholderiales bacterium]